MKISTLITAILLAAGLSAAALAQAETPAKDKVATATIVLAHCDANGAAPCDINNNTAGKSPEDSDPAALPPNDPKRQQAVEPMALVPEPQTFILLMLGLVVLGFASRDRGASEKFSD
ncbi:PEP-CTERM sorting domain-containing protein [Duganella sp. LjRoot269]|uniref:PEP-CTERM sorting domain-containing protein n=1 Tax=Duganella sp. LjRoot269 TaxID=3342305 RepID=UPI003ECC284E